MASSPAPFTPDNAPRRIAMNRSFTVPAKITTPTKPANVPPEIGSAEGIETLYTHPITSIIKFTTTSSRPSSSSSSPGRPQSSSGTLPWTSPTDRTMAAGPLEIYRVPGSVSFLHSGTLLHAIMPRSQCWCVDGVSKFVMRVLSDTYYRIELPGETTEDVEEVEKFKTTLRKVLFYERTPCPFARTFDVDLPEEPEVRKKRRKSAGPAKKWKLDRVWRPEGWVEPEIRGSEDSGSTSGSSASSGDESEPQDSQVGGGRTPADAESADEAPQPVVKMSQRARAMAALRSVSAPHAPTLASPSPSRLRTRVDLDGTVEVSELVESGSKGRETPTRLRTLQAIPTDMPPSPPDSSAGLDYTDTQTQHESLAGDEYMEAIQSLTGNEGTVERTIGETAQVDKVPQPETESITVDNTKDETFANVTPRDLLPEAQLIPRDDAKDEDVTEPEARLQRPEAPPIPFDYAKDEEATAFEFQTQQPANTIEMPKENLTPPPLQASIEETSEEHWSLTTSDPKKGSVEVRPITTVIQNSTQDFLVAAEQQQQPGIDSDHEWPTTPANQIAAEDPYAAIQARILARRSIGGTTAFYPSHKSPTRQSTSSTSSTATILSNKSAGSRRSRCSHKQQAYASAMVQKACSVFLGPPAHLVAIMLRIAARFANGAFGVDSMFYVESSKDAAHEVPGTYHLESSAVGESDSDWDEDDFGVPLISPVRRAGGRGTTDGVRERRTLDVD